METDDKNSQNLHPKDLQPKNLQELTDRIKEALISGNYDDLESKGALAIFNELSENEEFTQEIEQILACLNEQTLDLTKLQTLLIIIIKKYVGKFNRRKVELKLDEKMIIKNIAEVSHYLLHQRSLLVKEANRGLVKSKDNLYGISNKLIKETKRVIKNFAVYQIYKFMNPKRIAGETKKENFAYNFIKGGAEYAKKYEGGSKRDLAQYSPQFIKKLEREHRGFKGGGRTIY